MTDEIVILVETETLGVEVVLGLVVPGPAAAPGGATAVEIVDADYVASGASDLVVLFSLLTLPRVFTLPPADKAGQTVRVVDQDGSATVTENVLCVAQGTDTISRPANLTDSYGALSFVSDGLGLWTLDVIAMGSPIGAPIAISDLEYNLDGLMTWQQIAGPRGPLPGPAAWVSFSDARLYMGLGSAALEPISSFDAAGLADAAAAASLPLHAPADDSAKLAGTIPTAFGLAVLADADAAAGQTTFGLGSAASHAASDFAAASDMATKADLVGGVVPASQLPSYVDDVLEFANLAAFPVTGETGKIYVALDTNQTYRWSGTVYVIVGNDLALGETSSTAYRGDRGKTAYDHSQIVTGNPHGTTAADVGALASGAQAVDSAKLAGTTPSSFALTFLADATVAAAKATLGIGPSSFLPSGAIAETCLRSFVTASIAIAGGTMYLQAIELSAGMTISNIGFYAVQGITSPTHCAFGLYSAALGLLASSADQGNAAWSTSTLRTLAMTTPYVVPTSGLYYVAVLYSGSNLLLKGPNATGIPVAPILSGSSTASITSLPGTAGAITQGSSVWGFVS